MPRRYTPAAHCPCGRPMRGDRTKCGKCFGDDRQTIKKIGRIAVAPVHTNIDLRALVAQEQRDLAVRAARRLTAFDESVQEARHATVAARNIIDQHPEYAAVLNAATAQLQATDQSLRSSFVAAAASQQNVMASLAVTLMSPPAAVNSQPLVTAPAPTSNVTPRDLVPAHPASSQVTITDVTHVTCMLPHCEHSIEYSLRCLHMFCGSCLQGMISADIFRCPLCRAVFTEDDLEPVEIVSEPPSPTAAIEGPPTSPAVGLSALAIRSPPPARMDVDSPPPTPSGG